MVTATEKLGAAAAALTMLIPIALRMAEPFGEPPNLPPLPPRPQRLKRELRHIKRVLSFARRPFGPNHRRPSRLSVLFGGLLQP